MTAESRMPEFAIALRGYDRDQVDEYVARLRDWMAEAQSRVDLAESAAEAERRDATALRDRLAELESKGPQLPPSFESVGAKIARMLALAEESAAELRQRAEEDAEARLSQARQAADQLLRNAEARLAEARSAADELLRNAETRSREEAEARASDLITDARRLAGDIVRHAEERAAATVAEVEARHDRLTAEVAAILGRRQEIVEDLTRLRDAIDATITSRALEAPERPPDSVTTEVGVTPLAPSPATASAPETPADPAAHRTTTSA